MSLIEEALRRRKASQTVPADAARRTAVPLRESATASQKRTIGDPARRRHLDRDALRQSGLLPPVSEEGDIAHQFRSIKRPLIQQIFQEPPVAPADRAQRSIMVSSALPGDGKTFTSLNLALSLAMERDYSVILVDGDVLKPHISQVFNASKEPGLLDVLESPSLGIESVILPTDVRGFSVLPVGRQTLQATELLASARMRSVVLELEALDPQGIVVLDSPPILLTSEARVLAGLFAQVVMVVRAGGTPQQAALDAIRLIGQGPHVNLVLNQALHVSGGYYGYGSGAAYGEVPAEGAPR